MNNNILLYDLESWLNKFELNTIYNKKESFINDFKVYSYGEIISLKQYLHKLKIQRDIQPLIDVYNNRKKLLINFYNTSLKINNKPLKDYDDDIEIHKFINHRPRNAKNIIRNMFLNEILYDTESNIHNMIPYLRMLDLFINKKIIEYRLLTLSVLSLFQSGHIGNTLSGIYFRASIMNPHIVYNIYKQLAPNAKHILTPTLGWGSYINGLLETGNIESYTGIDVIPNVCYKVDTYYKNIYPNTNINIICKPSEDIWNNITLRNKLKNKMDLVFFSPPYWKLELYKGGEQSTERYKTYDEWLDKYWHNTIKLCHFSLKKGGIMIYIISGYGAEKDYINLEKDMNNITQKYFKNKGNYPVINTNVGFTKHRTTKETIFVWEK